MAAVKRRNSFGCCLGGSVTNKVLPSPSDTSVRHRRVAVDNFFQRGQGDGASDVDQPHKLERHVSGYSFSTRTTIGDMESQAGLSDMYTSASDSDDSDSDDVDDDDSVARDNDEMKTVITEGGLSKVAIELDHPFAPYYQGLDEADIPGMLLSDTRLRTAGFYMPDRSTLNRSADSRMSTFTEWDPALNRREDTPVPGKRPRNLVHHLAKHKTCPIVRQGHHVVLGRHVPVVSDVISERADTPGGMSTQRTTARGDLTTRDVTALSTARTLPADDVDSLASSNSNLSAIGEQLSESSTTSGSDSDDAAHEPGGACETRPEATGHVKAGASQQQQKQLSMSHNLSNGLLRSVLDDGANIKVYLKALSAC